MHSRLVLVEAFEASASKLGGALKGHTARVVLTLVFALAQLSGPLPSSIAAAAPVVDSADQGQPDGVVEEALAEVAFEDRREQGQKVEPDGRHGS